MTPRPERIRPADVARITGLSRRQVQAMALAGLLPSAAKLGSLWTFDERRIRAWLIDRERESAATAGAVTSASAIRRCDAAIGLPDAGILAAYERAIGLKPRGGQRR